MSTNFTGYDGSAYDWDGFDFAAVDAFNELITSYNEIRDVFYYGSATAKVAGDIVTDMYGAQDLLRDMQDFVLFLIDNTYVVNHTVHNDAYTAFDSVTYFSRAAFYTSAGMDSGGFRRYNGDDWDGTADPTFEYGTIEVGDIYAWWIYEDLQRAFSTIQVREFVLRSWRPDSGLNESRTTARYDPDTETIDDAKAEASANFPGDVSLDFGKAEAYKGKYTGIGVIIETRYKTVGYADSGYTPYELPRGATVRCYARAVAYGTFDAQGTDFLEDTYSLVDTLTVAQAGTAVSAKKIGYDYTTGEPPNWFVGSESSRGFTLSVYAGLFAWDFTYSNEET